MAIWAWSNFDKILENFGKEMLSASKTLETKDDIYVFNLWHLCDTYVWN